MQQAAGSRQQAQHPADCSPHHANRNSAPAAGQAYGSTSSTCKKFGVISPKPMVVQVTNMNHTPSRVISQDDLSSASAMPLNT